jgi:hypothetical protein
MDSLHKSGLAKAEDELAAAFLPVRRVEEVPPTTRSESCRRTAAVRRAGGLRGLSEDEASCAVGAGRDGAALGGGFEAKIVATVLSGG